MCVGELAPRDPIAKLYPGIEIAQEARLSTIYKSPRDSGYSTDKERSMKRCSLFLTGMISLSLTAFILMPGARSDRPAVRALVSPGTQADAEECRTSPAAMRWRQGLPTHWRACLLHQ